MNVPLSWLKTYVKYPEDLAVADFAEAMIMSGSEVEGYEEMGQDIENVVTGRVVEMKRHEDSDHLWVCMIDVGKENLLQIVTGAQNVTVGAMVPVAMDGAVLPGGKTIKSGALRGVKSEGMLCSGEELNVDPEQFPESAVYGIWILKEDTPIGLDIRTVIGCDEVIVEFKTLANRPDCMCMAGIAREVAATFDTELTLPEISVKESDGNIADYVSVTVEDSDLCPRYCARVVKNIRLAPSPAWMQKALIGAGVRPINNVVDITNYVMLEQGQPMHAFDYSCIRGSHITVRKSAADDVFTTLDGKEHELSMQPLCICDDEGVIGLAGIMGGLNSEITENTQTVVLESAVFNGAYLRTSARALGMRTEASARYEKGVSIKGAQVALERAAQLFEQLDAGDVVCGVIDVKPEEWTEYTFTASADAVRAHLGMDIPTDTIITGDSLQANGTICQGVGFYKSLPDYLYTLDKLTHTPIQNILCGHDYEGIGYWIPGEAEVKKALAYCRGRVDAYHRFVCDRKNDDPVVIAQALIEQLGCGMPERLFMALYTVTQHLERSMENV